MPDLERHLTEQFGMARTSQQWIDAWDLRDPSAKEGQPEEGGAEEKAATATR